MKKLRIASPVNARSPEWTAAKNRWAYSGAKLNIADEYVETPIARLAAAKTSAVGIPPT
jgi:hypothetical protein